MKTFRILYNTKFMGWADEIELPDDVTADDVRRASKEKDAANYDNIVEIFEI